MKEILSDSPWSIFDNLLTTTVSLPTTLPSIIRAICFAVAFIV
jgi:hypothetical protein